MCSVVVNSSGVWRWSCFTCRSFITAKLSLISKSECSANEANAVTDEEADKFLEAAADSDDDKKMETDAADDADNLVCFAASVWALQTGWTERDAVWAVDVGGSKEPWWQLVVFPGKGAILGVVPPPLKCIWLFDSKRWCNTVLGCRLICTRQCSVHHGLCEAWEWTYLPWRWQVWVWFGLFSQVAQLSPMRHVSWNLANCHATVKKLLVRQVLNHLSAVANWPVRQNRAVDSAWLSVQ